MRPVLKPLVAALAAVAIVAGCVGCGGGGSSEAPKVQAAAAQCVPFVGTIRVQLFGDSTQEGYEGGKVPSALAPKTPTILLQEALDARFGHGATLVTSRAVQGTTAAQLVAGTDGRNQPWPGSVDAEVVVENHGINDMQAHESIETYKGLLRTLASRATILETPNWVQSWDIAPYAQAVRDVAAEMHLPVADTYTADPKLGDWAHPSQAGYENIVTLSLAPAVVAAVAALLCQ